jgi:serine phosphatase RsbU (regulator of sigma subunit)
MQTPSIEEIALLPEREAARKAFLGNNYRTCLLLAAVSSGLAVAWGVRFALGTLDSDYLVAGGLFLLLSFAFLALRNEPLLERHWGLFVPLYAAVQLVLPGLFLPGWVAWLSPVFVLFGLALLVLHPAEHVCLFGLQWLVLMVTAEQPGAAFRGRTTGMTAVVVAFLGLALFLTWFLKQLFLKQWRRVHLRALERERMREELESARRIQLAMLPQGPPDLPWIELAAASMPAAEVGGDYYDYFRLPDDRLVVVIADVAGHGLAPALLLSGVRSCLYLLEEELAVPVPVLERLTRMVRRTSGRRNFVTLLVAVIDRRSRTLRVASAGHPPLLVWQPACGVAPVGHPAAPLGTFLGSRYREDERALAGGDILVLYTDGLIEAQNDRGEEYGEARLGRIVASSVHRASARGLRDSVLSDLSTFRGNAAQEDDFTLVVARLR